MFKQTGFALIEVMVAVAILAFSLTALVKIVGQTSNTLSYLEQKTYAQWVAINLINEIEVERTWPKIGKTRGEETMAGIDFFWEIVSSNTDSKDLRRIDIKIKKERIDEDSLYSLTAFVHQP
jgi:general secretion pathway protein I